MNTRDTTTSWIKWAGGHRPVDAEQRVEVRLADGDVLIRKAWDLTWYWFPPYKTLTRTENRNIVAYRKV
jgi:hypothetical protein